MASWACAHCTFLNEAAEAPVCELCALPRSNPPDAPTRARTASPTPTATALTAQTVDLTESPEPSGRREESTDDAQRRAIMAMASSVNSGGDGGSKRKRSQPPPSSMSEGAAESDQRAAIMRSAAAANASGANSLLAELAAQRHARRPPSPAHTNPATTAHAGAAGAGGAAGAVKGPSALVVLSYNLWFNEELSLRERMGAIGAAVAQHEPHVVCAQEATDNICRLLKAQPWAKRYDWAEGRAPMCPYFTLLLVRKSLKHGPFRMQLFPGTQMGRGLVSCKVHTEHGAVVVGTSHLESPIPPYNGPALMSGPRKAQLAQALRWCEAAAAEPTESALIAGDMNWNDSNDGAMSLGGWMDAWVMLRPSEKGFTFDTTVNKMLTFKLRARLDRVLCKLSGWRAQAIEMIGTTPIDGVQHVKTFSSGRQRTLPVYPSDHFGLLLTLVPSQGSVAAQQT